jgi:hypothetical protein
MTTHEIIKSFALIVFTAFVCALTVHVIDTVDRVGSAADHVDELARQTERDVKATVDGITSTADARLTDLIRRTDARTGEALAIAEELPSLIDRHAANTETILDSQLTAINVTIERTAKPIGDLAKEYAALPDQIGTNRETQGLIAETMGVLGATKVTMGEAAKAAKTFDQKWPEMLANGDRISGSAEGIAEDVKREADQLTKPQTFWAQFRTWLLTLARIWAAV